jgi:hypothetical protein
MYEAAFKNIDDTLWKDAGCSQWTWLHLKVYLDFNFPYVQVKTQEL